MFELPRFINLTVPAVASGAKVVSPEEAPQLRNYLTWLELPSNEPSPNAPAPITSAVAPVRDALVEVELALPTKNAKKQRSSGQGKAPTVKPSERASVQQEFDVELVKTPEASPAPVRRSRCRGSARAAAMPPSPQGYAVQ